MEGGIPSSMLVMVEAAARGPEAPGDLESCTYVHSVIRSARMNGRPTLCWGSSAEQNPRVLPLHPLPGAWASMSVCLSAPRIPLRGWWRPAQPCSGDRVWRGGRPEVLVSSTWD